VQRLYNVSPGATSLQACALAQFHYWADLVAFNAADVQLFVHFKDKGLSNFNSQARGQDLSLKSSAFKQLKFLVYCCCS